MFDIKKIIKQTATKIPPSLYNIVAYRGYGASVDTMLLSYEQLLKHQNNSLQTILKNASSLEFYKQFNVDPQNINSFPIVSKHDLLHSYSQLKSRKGLGVVDIATSGSSGEPFKFARHLSDLRFDRLSVMRTFHRYGFKPNAKLAMLRSYIPQQVTDSKIQQTQNVTWFSAYHMDELNMRDYVNWLNKYKIEFMLAYPSSGYILAKYCIDRKLELPYLKAVFLSSEKMTQQWQATMQVAWPEAEVIDRYGTAEFSNSFSSCSICKGYHINEDYGHTELLPIDGEANRFEIIGTGFYNSAFPMIRYNMKDVFRLDKVKDSQCEYGSQVYCGEIEGRTSDLIWAGEKQLPGVNFYTLFYYFEDSINQFQLVQHDTESLLIRLVLRDNITPSAELEAQLTEKLQMRVGKLLELNFQYIDSIERDLKSGKVKNIISTLK